MENGNNVAVAISYRTMSLHILGQKCPVCNRKGLVIGEDDGAGFRPQGWILKRLPGRHVACPHCGSVIFALLPASLKALRTALRQERANESMTYHSRPKPKKSPE